MKSATDRDADLRARIQQHWEASERGDIDAEHAIYAADAILDYPQSGERVRGRSRIQAQRGGHPAERHFTIRRILGGGDLWVSECVITYDGVPTCSLSVMEITEELEHPGARNLLESATLLRLAYNGSDGFPRVIPIGFYWKGARSSSARRRPRPR